MSARGKTYLKWFAFWVLFTVAQIVAVQVGRYYGDQNSFGEGMCKVNGSWNSVKMCREQGVSGRDVWRNYDGSFTDA